MKSAHDPAAQHKDPDLLLEHGSIASRPTSPIAQSISDEIQAGLGDLHSDLVAGLYAPRPLSQHRSQNVRKSTHQFEAIEESVEEHQHPVEWPEPIASRSWEESVGFAGAYPGLRGGSGSKTTATQHSVSPSPLDVEPGPARSNATRFQCHPHSWRGVLFPRPTRHPQCHRHKPQGHFHGLARRRSEP
jgi:hypothetical protein